MNACITESSVRDAMLLLHDNLELSHEDISQLLIEKNMAWSFEEAVLKCTYLGTCKQLDYIISSEDEDILIDGEPADALALIVSIQHNPDSWGYCKNSEILSKWLDKYDSNIKCGINIPLDNSREYSVIEPKFYNAPAAPSFLLKIFKMVCMR